MKKSYFIPLAVFALLTVGIWQFANAQTLDNFIYLPIIKKEIRPAVVSYQGAYASKCEDAPANEMDFPIEESDPPVVFPNDVAKLALRATLDGALNADGKVVWIFEDVPVYEFGFEVEDARQMIVSEYFGQPFQCGRQLSPGTYRVQLFANDKFLYEGTIEIAR